ncbi:hypothetical protein H8900_002761 [Salmonella enterica]|nr:hypothetical protein [Salmonella enterica]EGC2196427.1 hypothetical protein [Salmonella enterica]
MTIDKHTLCIENAFDIENQLYELANNEIECDSFAVTSTNENGTEIEFERPITDLALEAASTINALLKRLESKEKLVTDLVTENEALKYQEPKLAAMMSCLDAFYADEGVPERAMMAAYNILRKSVRTTDTDVFLAEVRAQGADELAELYFTLAAHEANRYIADSWRESARFAKDHAAQIRQEAAK